MPKDSENVAQLEASKKRGRKAKPLKRKGYFYEEEEQAFVQYINSTDQRERDKIFREKLYPAFTKMIESIIRRYELFVPSEDFDDTFNDTMSFLITKVNNYDLSKGYKVYSYCGTVCKNYLILRRSKDMQNTKRILSYESVFPTIEKDNRRESNTEFMNKINSDVIKQTAERIKEMLAPDYTPKLKKNEISIGYALLALLTNWEDLFKCVGSKKFNKSCVLLFIKEYTLLSTPEVRNGMKKFKSLYYSLKENLLSE
jgi:hypothetical protein